MNVETSEFPQSVQAFNEAEFRRIAEKDGVTHISTGIAVVKDDKILLVRRAVDDYLGGNYELPGGGVDTNETIVASAIRELKEETGLEVTNVISSFDGFDYKTDKKPHVRQVNFLVQTAKHEVLLDPAEHDDYKWITDQDLKDLIMSLNMFTCVKNSLELIKLL